jgi:glyceraldehyde 3-phosphate dehydrogenase
MQRVKVGINGFGRIGRQVFRVIQERYLKQLEVVAVNDLFDVNTNFHLLQYDSSYGRANLDLKIDGNTVHLGDWNVKNFAERDPARIPWADVGAQIIIESTGVFNNAKEASVHMASGAKKVIITAPAKGQDLTIVMGVNEKEYNPAKHSIISNASCTTNCLAPPAMLLEREFGILSGTMTTIHSYTNAQRILDLPHRDLRRARAAACNIIPTSTGAAQAVAEVIPSLKGRFTGWSLRVPTPTVSLVDFTAILAKPTDTASIRALFKKAAEGELKNILGYSEQPLVSMDFKGDPRSAIVDAEYTTVQEGTLAKVVAWYDNEWGYSCRVADLADFMVKKGL